MNANTFFLCVSCGLLSGCQTLSTEYRPTTEPVTLTHAIAEVTKALGEIATSSDPKYGLLPDEVTVELAIAVAEGDQSTSGMKITAGTFLAQLPEISSTRVRSATTTSGNKITIKFKNVALAPTLRTREEVESIKIDWKDIMIYMPNEKLIGEVPPQPDAPVTR